MQSGTHEMRGRAPYPYPAPHMLEYVALGFNILRRVNRAEVKAALTSACEACPLPVHDPAAAPWPRGKCTPRRLVTTPTC